jgi:zinc protease
MTIQTSNPPVAPLCKRGALVKLARTLGGISAVVWLALSPSFANPPVLPQFPPLEFHPPKPSRVVLPNGLVIFLLEDHELPLIHVDALIRAGAQYDPPDKIGLSDIFGSVLTQGGTLKQKPDEILKLLDSTGGSISFSVSTEDASGSLSCRAGDFDKLFATFSDLLTQPDFSSDYVTLEKGKSQESLRRMNDEPEDIARREFRKVVYGKDHPYARTPTPQTIDRIKRKDLLDMHKRYFKPNVTMLAVSGDFKSEEMKQKIALALGGWTSGEVTYPILPKARPTEESALYYVQRPIDQSQIRIGHTGFTRHNPDHFAFEVFNELWGGSATSELFRTVRTQKGLAYQVASVFTEPGDLGLIVAVCQTRGPETPEAIQSIRTINRDVRSAPFSEERVRFAKESLRNRFVENFTSSAQIDEQVMAMEFRGYPPDYLDTYTDKINHVTLADLKRVGEKYLHPDQSVILVVGDLSTFDKPLSTLGRPQEVRIPDYRLEANQP